MTKRITAYAVGLLSSALLLALALASCVGQKPSAESANDLGGLDMKEGNAKYGEVSGVQVLGAGGIKEFEVDNDAKKVRRYSCRYSNRVAAAPNGRRGR
jgi:hypothetical protein